MYDDERRPLSATKNAIFSVVDDDGAVPIYFTLHSCIAAEGQIIKRVLCETPTRDQQLF